MSLGREWTHAQYERWSTDELARYTAPPDDLAWIETFLSDARVEEAFRSLQRSGVHPTWICTMVIKGAIGARSGERDRPRIRALMKSRKLIADRLRRYAEMLESMPTYISSRFTNTLPHVKELANVLQDDPLWAIFRPDGKYISELTILPKGRRPTISRNVCLAVLDAELMRQTGRHWSGDVAALLDAAFESHIAVTSLERMRKRAKKKRA